MERSLETYYVKGGVCEVGGAWVSKVANGCLCSECPYWIGCAEMIVRIWEAGRARVVFYMARVAVNGPLRSTWNALIYRTDVNRFRVKCMLYSFLLYIGT